MKICVLGLGYIGLPTAVMLASAGHDVIGVDIKQDVLSAVGNGNSHIDEPGLDELLKEAVYSGKLRTSSAPVQSDAFIIAVPTPLNGKSAIRNPKSEVPSADLSFVKVAATSIAPILRRDNLVVLESTSPPGTTEEVLVTILEKESGLKAGEDFYVAYCPERVLPGRILHEIVHNARIIGGIDSESAERAEKLYSSFVKGEIYITDARTAEMVKLAENTFRDLNIAFANELSRICHRLGVNVWEVIQLANRHPRVNILKPGPGVGGHCIAVDPWFIVEKAPQEARLIRTAREVNDSQPQYIFERIKELVGDIERPKIAVMGVAYKGNVGDTRESPALRIVDLLKKNGYEVSIYDPYVEGYESVEGVFDDADCIVLLTAHDLFRELSPKLISISVRGKIVFDTKSLLDREKWESAGFEVETL